MLKFRKEKRAKDFIVTTHELGNYILENKVIPTPTYSKINEQSYVAQTRGTIFAKIKRRRPLEF